MRLLLIFCLILVFHLPLYSQKTGDIMIINEECKLYDIPSITGKARKISPNDTITILRPEDPKTGFYYVRYKSTNGYINAIKIVLTKKLDYPEYRSNYESQNREAKSLDDLVKFYTSLYGKPDDSSLFSTEYLKSRTLLWFCAGGKYRLIRLKLEKGIWVKESEESADCIKSKI
jgi:hypothetical protein